MPSSGTCIGCDYECLEDSNRYTKFKFAKTGRSIALLSACADSKMIVSDGKKQMTRVFCRSRGDLMI